MTTHDSDKIGPVAPVFRRLARFIDPFQPAEGPPPQQLRPFFGWALRGAWPAITAAMVASVCVGLASVYGFYLIGWLIDTAQAQGQGFLAANAGTVAMVAAFFVVIWPASQILNAVFNSVILAPNLFALVLNRLNRHMLGQSLSYFDNDFAGRIAQKAQQTSRAMTDVITEVTNIVGNAISAALSAMFVLALVDFRLAIAIFLWLAAYAALIRWYVPKIRVRSKKRAAERAKVTGQIVDTVTNIATVKLFAHNGAEETATQEALAGYREAGISWAGTVATFRLIIFVLAGVLPAALVVLALWLWSRDLATAGDIAASGLIATRLATMTGWVSFAALGIFTNIGEIDDGIRTLSPAHQITDHETAAAPVRAQGDIRFDDVSFAYGGSVAALQNFALSIRPGEKVALVGESGAGKSTVMSLLLRLYDVEKGRILLDGTDIRSLTQEGLRRQIGMVRQETAMFNRSARDNIAYGRTDASMEDVIAAAKAAEAHEFILKLRDHRGRTGYEAFLGERGVKLSGGQRQRIALARAFLKDAPILALDEATSALDSEVEAAIQTALARIMEGKTVLAIAHRLSTIAQMDRIIVLEQGQIVEEGTHDDLLAAQGVYARYWARQSGGFLMSDDTKMAG